MELAKVKTEVKEVSNEGIASYFTSPSNKKYFATTETDFLLSGNTSDGVTGVYINNYQLKNFSSKEKKFYYRAKTDIGTLKNGVNTYTLAFIIGGKKIEKETITVFLAATEEEAQVKEKEYEARIQEEKTKALDLEQKKTEENNTITAKIAPLDPLYYYDKNLKRFSLQFVFTEQTPYMEVLATEIANHIKTL